MQNITYSTFCLYILTRKENNNNNYHIINIIHQNILE